MERYDERSIAEEMHDKQTFIKSFSVNELSIYAKWLKYKEIIKLKGEYTFDGISEDEMQKIDSSVEAGLIDFSNKHYGAFNYNLHYKKIDKAMGNTRLYRLKLPLPTVITKKEWDTILQDGDELHRRVLLVMLIDAKYSRYNSPSLKFDYETARNLPFCVFAKKDKEIFDLANVKVPKEDKEYFFSSLCDNGYCSVTEGRRNFYTVNFVDTDPDSEIFYEVTDYDNINLYYDLFVTPDKVGFCKYCGALFKQNKYGNAMYCSKHRGYRKIGVGKCVDCGEEFILAPNKVRCDKCQSRKVKIDARARVEKFRNKALKRN